MSEGLRDKFKAERGDDLGAPFHGGAVAAPRFENTIAVCQFPEKCAGLKTTRRPWESLGGSRALPGR